MDGPDLDKLADQLLGVFPEKRDPLLTRWADDFISQLAVVAGLKKGRKGTWFIVDAQVPPDPLDLDDPLRNLFPFGDIPDSGCLVFAKDICEAVELYIAQAGPHVPGMDPNWVHADRLSAHGGCPPPAKGGMASYLKRPRSGRLPTLAEFLLDHREASG